MNYGIIDNVCIYQGSFSFFKKTASYTSGKMYCGFIVAKNNGTISNCEVLGSFFQFAMHAPCVEAYAGAMCGQNTGTVTGCQVTEAIVQLTTGYGGGIVGYNEGGSITNCTTSYSYISCYQDFSADTSDGYTTSHYAAVGGIVGYTKGGTISSCTVTSDVEIRYNGYSSESRTLAPEMGIIAGRSSDRTTITGYISNGVVEQDEELQVVTWQEGWWIFAQTYTWDQTQYVGGVVGRYI